MCLKHLGYQRTETKPPSTVIATLYQRLNLLIGNWLLKKRAKSHSKSEVITVSDVIVTLILAFFAFSAAVAKGNQFGNFNGWEAILLAVALILFILSSLFGLTTNRPRNYGVLSLEIPAQPERQGPASAQRAHNGGVSQRDD